MATAKALKTRALIYQTALALFAERGYEKTTMRQVAESAGTSLGLTYRYFKRKDDIVLELYRRTVADFEERVAQLAPGTVSERLRAALELKIELCAPHREVFSAVVPTTLSPQSEAFALGSDAGDIRARVVSAYQVVLEGGNDVEGLPSLERVALMCFVVQLAVLFYWLHDASAGQRATHRLVGLLCESAHLGLGLLMMPEVDDSLATLVELLLPLFGAPRGRSDQG